MVMLGRMMNSRKTIWYLISVAAAALILMTAGLMLTVKMGGNVSEAKNAVDTVDVKSVKIDDSAAHAGKLFAAKAEDINDTEQIVELFEVMGLQEVTGEYTVEISMDEGIQTLKLSVAEPVQRSDKKVFNRNMKKYAQQMLTLIPQVDKVEWSYSVITAKGNEKDMTASFDANAFCEKFGKDPDKCSTSKDAVQKMLRTQSGKDK